MRAFSALRQRIQSSWSTVSLRSYLIGLVLLGTVPIAALLGYQIVAGGQRQQQEIDHHLRETATLLASSVERELRSSVDALTILSYAGSLQRDDLAQFKLELTLLPQTRPSWRSAYLVDRDGNVIFDTADPYGQQATKLRGSPAFERVLATGAAVVSDLVTDPRNGAPITAIQVPVLIGGKLHYVLGAWIDPAIWQEMVGLAGKAGVGFTSLYDGQRRLIARAQPAAAPLRPRPGAVANSDRGGVLQWSSAADEDRLYRAREVVPLAGWSVDAGMAPAAAVSGRAISGMLVTAAASLVVGIVMALLAARHITEPLEKLATKDLAKPLRRVVVREVALLRDALLAASSQEESARAQLQRKRDLLERKAAEFETLFASSPIGLAFIEDAKVGEVIHNAAMDSLFGPAESEDTVQVLMQGQRLKREQQPLQSAAATGLAVTGIELEVRSAGQPARFVLASAVPLRDANERPRGAIGAVVDITERKRAEAQLIDTDYRLRESQHLVDLAQEAGRVGFFHYRFDSGVLTWTPGLAKLFELDTTQLEGDFDSLLARLEPADQAELKNALRRVFAARQEKETLEFRVNLGHGASRWLSSRVMITYAEDGRPLQMIGATLDMTDQKAAEAERVSLMEREQAARLEAEAANRAKDEFLAMLGHELRNPLSAIASAVEVLNRTDAAGDLAGNARGIIARQTRHLARLMDDLLDVARVISGKIPLARRHLDLAELVQRMVTTMQVTGSTDRHELSLDLDEVWIDADATRIEQVVNNLIANALKYTPAEGRVAIRVANEDGQALLEIRDSGVGIPATLLPHIFGLFVQGERTLDRRAGGLGVGLTLVRRLVEMHGGTITASSSDAGAVFTVRLPAIEPQLPVEEHPCLPESRRRRVAVIEDNEDALNALRSMLELDGHTVWTAVDGISGLASLLDVRPDVAVVDIGLPGLTGFEVAKRSRAAGYAGRMIALSGYGQGHDIHRALAAGFDAHVVKPVDPEELRRLMTQD